MAGRGDNVRRTLRVRLMSSHRRYLLMSFSTLAQSSAYDVSNDWLSAWEFHTVMCHNGVMFRLCRHPG